MKGLIKFFLACVMLAGAMYCIAWAVKLDGNQFWLSFGGGLFLGSGVAILHWSPLGGR